MTIVVTGGTGFTGERVVQQVIAHGILPTVIARSSASTAALRSMGARIVHADLDQPQTLHAAFAGHDTLLYVASMGFGQIPSVVAEACATGIKRAVFVSTTAVLTRLPVRSKPIRAAAEQCVRESNLEWTVIRPTMIYGSHRDRNMCRLLRHLSRWRIAPLPGRGMALQQPVHVDDVAKTIVAAALNPRAIGKSYNISGAYPMSLRQLIECAAAEVGVRALFLPLPAAASERILALLERTGLRLPVRSEQLARLNEDKAFDHSDAMRDLGVVPRAFQEGIRQEAIELGLARAL